MITFKLETLRSRENLQTIEEIEEKPLKVLDTLKIIHLTSTSKAKTNITINHKTKQK